MDEKVYFIKEVLKIVAIFLSFELIVAWAFIAGCGFGHLLW